MATENMSTHSQDTVREAPRPLTTCYCDGCSSSSPVWGNDSYAQLSNGNKPLDTWNGFPILEQEMMPSFPPLDAADMDLSAPFPSSSYPPFPYMTNFGAKERNNLLAAPLAPFNSPGSLASLPLSWDPSIEPRQQHDDQAVQNYAQGNLDLELEYELNSDMGMVLQERPSLSDGGYSPSGMRSPEGLFSDAATDTTNSTPDTLMEGIDLATSPPSTQPTIKTEVSTPNSTRDDHTLGDLEQLGFRLHDNARQQLEAMKIFQ